MHGGRHQKAPPNTPVPEKFYICTSSKLLLELHSTDTVCIDPAPTHLHTPRLRVPRLRWRAETSACTKQLPPSSPGRVLAASMFSA